MVLDGDYPWGGKKCAPGVEKSPRDTSEKGQEGFPLLPAPSKHLLLINF